MHFLLSRLHSIWTDIILMQVVNETFISQISWDVYHGGLVCSVKKAAKLPSRDRMELGHCVSGYP